jgi:hypothetical protein
VRSFTAVAEKAIGTNGFCLFGALTSIMAVLKLTVIADWSWRRVSLPIAIFVGFDTVHILVGFSYLSLVNIRERPPESETARLEGRHRIPRRLDLAAVLRALRGQSGQMAGGRRSRLLVLAAVRAD